MSTLSAFVPFLAATPALQAPPKAPATLERVAVIRTAAPGAEIFAVQAATRRAALTHSANGTVELFDLADPAQPRSVRVIELGLARGEELTSVALPASGEWLVAAVKAGGRLAPGRALVQGLDGKPVASFPCGVGPDSVAIAPDGRRILVANEAEGFDDRDDELVSAPGSLTLIELEDDVARARVTQIPLADAPELPTDARTLEREVDDEEEEIPLESRAEFLEPECVVFLPGAERALVTLQENNAVAYVRLVPPSVERVLALGNTTHPADLVGDQRFRDDGALVARREPDGLALTPDGLHFLTADEGDTGPNVEKTPPGKPVGGGRTLSVFELSTGAFVADTGPELDRAAAKAGLYPDGRSPKKGSEPEMVVAFERDGRTYAAVTLERAGALALVDLADPRRPVVLGVTSSGADPRQDEPEGLAHFRDPSGEADYLYVANEGTGTLGVLRVLRQP